MHTKMCNRSAKSLMLTICSQTNISAQDRRCLPCRAGRAHMRISVHESYWSKTINLESVGINTQTHTYAPTNSVGRASRMDMDVMMEDVIKFENQFPIEPGAQVPGRKRNSSRMYAFVSNLLMRSHTQTYMTWPNDSVCSHNHP